MHVKTERVKGLLIGDNFVGKRALARRCAGGSAPSPEDRSWLPEETHVVDVYIMKSHLKGSSFKEDIPIKVEIALWILRPFYDDEAPRLRDLILENAKVVAICYSVNDRESLENAINKVCIPYTIILRVY
jgi:hypothetical protein